MLKPGLARAIPAAILGYLAGAALLIVLRVAFGIIPYWHLGLSLILGTFLSAYAFVWGLGGFNPAMSEHAPGPEASAIVPSEDALAANARPLNILSHTIWQVTFITLVVLLVLLAVTFVPGGPALRVTSQADASVNAVGTLTVPFLGSELVLNQLVLFALFMVWLMISLAAVGGIIGVVFFFLSRQVAVARKMPATPFTTEPLAAPNRLQRTLGRTAGRAAQLIGGSPERVPTTAITPAPSSGISQPAVPPPPAPGQRPATTTIPAKDPQA